MTITHNGTTLQNSGLGAVVTNIGEGCLTNAAAVTDEHCASPINIAMGATLTNEEASTVTDTGATLLSGSVTIANTSADAEFYNLAQSSHGARTTNTGTGTVLTNKNGGSLINGASSAVDNRYSAMLTDSAKPLRNDTINNSASLEDIATGMVLGGVDQTPSASNSENARCFLCLANLDHGGFKHVNRYETALVPDQQSPAHARDFLRRTR